MTKRFVGSGRVQEGGFLATHKQDFNSHVEGGDFFHDASHIRMNPVLPAFAGQNVQTTLEQISAFSASQGTGYISIGNDGYDGYATGAYNVSNSVDLETAFQNAFADDRLQNGGIILLLSGTYKINNTITVPPGISIVGENSGTIIIGEMGEVPMFKFSAGGKFPTIGGDSGAGELPLEVGSPLDESQLMNLILVDNLNGVIQSAGEPIASMQTVPMVSLEVSSRVHIKNVKFIGRLNNGAVLNRAKTLRAIGTEPGGVTGTELVVDRCYFDGLETGIRFEPGNDDIDTLVITNCRARIFGDEGTGSPVNEENTFLTFTLCNLTADNNYIVGASTSNARVRSCFYVLSGNPDNTFLNISNTSGGSSQNTSNSVLLVTGASGTNYRGSITNNSWGGDFGDGWYLTIGGPSADFAGVEAIDLVLSLTSPEWGPTTIIINGGNYTVTVAGNRRYNFIGKSSALQSPPVVTLNLGGSAPNDEFGRRRFDCGNIIENVRFYSAGVFHVIRPGGNSSVSGVEVKKCKFINTGLSVNDSTNIEDVSSITVNNCDFDQTGTFDDDVSLVLPNVHDRVVIENCTFGGGYAAFIGRNNTPLYGVTNSSTVLDINDCKLEGPNLGNVNNFDIVGYFVVNQVSRCQVNNSVFSDQEVTFTPGPGSLFNSSPFAINPIEPEDYASYYFDCNSCSLSSSDFNGGALIYDSFSPLNINVGSYTTIGTKIVSSRKVTIDGCRFNSSILDLEGEAREGISISNSSFFGDESSSVSQLKVTLNNNVNPDELEDLYNLRISNCNFRSISEVNTTSSSGSLHLGNVNIQSSDCNIFISNNRIYSLFSGNKNFGTYTPSILGGIIVKNTGNVITKTDINNNDIVIRNLYTSDSDIGTICDLYVDSYFYNIHSNSLRHNNASSVGTGTENCLYVLSSDFGLGNLVSDRIYNNISFNQLSRRDDSGSATNLSNNFGYIYIEDGGGVAPSVTKNYFSDDTVGSLAASPNITLTASDFTGDDEPLIIDNYNEIYTKRIHHDGVAGISAGINSDITVVSPGSGSSITSFVLAGVNPSNNAYTFDYNDTGTLLNFVWRVNLDSILPIGATIVNVSVPVDVTANPTTSSIAQLVCYFGSSTGTTDIITPLTTTGGLLEVIPPSNNQRLSRSANNYIDVLYVCNSSSSCVFTVGRITIQYKL